MSASKQDIIQTKESKLNLFKGKRVVITGGLGFIGSNLAIELSNYAASITLIDSLIPEYGGNLFNIEPVRAKIVCNISDIRDPHSLRPILKDADFIFNLAGQTSHLDSMIDPMTDLDINAKAQLSILEVIREVALEAKVIFASTRQIYGKPKFLPVDETHPINPVDVNGINKTAGEWYHTLYQQNYGIKATVLRLTNTFGPRMRVKDARQTFLGTWILRAIRKEPILVYGDGLQKRDLNFVDDVVNAFIFAATTDACIGETFNLGADNPINLLELSKKLLDISSGSEIKIIPFPSELKSIDIGDYYSDFLKFKNISRWSPIVDLDSGLEQTVDYYKKFMKEYV